MFLLLDGACSSYLYSNIINSKLSMYVWGNAKYYKLLKVAGLRKMPAGDFLGVTAWRLFWKHGTMTQSEDNDLHSEKQCSCMWKQNNVFWIQGVRWDLNKFPNLFNHRTHIIFYHSNQLPLSNSIITTSFKHKIILPSFELQYSNVCACESNDKTH
jgi:hypothetical protein